MKLKMIVGLAIGVVADLAILALPMPVGVRAGLAPLVAGVIVGLYSDTKLKAILASLLVGVAVLVAAFAYNYFQAPTETMLAVNRPGFYSFIPVIVQLVVPVLASLGTVLLKPSS